MFFKIPYFCEGKAEKIAMIGGADGPTAIYVASSDSALILIVAAAALVVVVVLVVVLVRRFRR